MTIAGMESPIISDKEELITKRITKKARLNGSLSASDSGLDVNPHMPPSMPPSMATFLNSIKQTNFEKTTSSQSSATPEQTIHPSMTVDLQASVVKRGITPTALAMVLDMENMIGAAGCRVFLDEMIQESGNPFDPVEIMLLEQFGYVPLVFDSNTSLVQKG